DRTHDWCPARCQGVGARTRANVLVLRFFGDRSRRGGQLGRRLGGIAGGQTAPRAAGGVFPAGPGGQGFVHTGGGPRRGERGRGGGQRGLGVPDVGRRAVAVAVLAAAEPQILARLLHRRTGQVNPLAGRKHAPVRQGDGQRDVVEDYLGLGHRLLHLGLRG